MFFSYGIKALWLFAGKNLRQLQNQICTVKDYIVPDG